MDHIELPTKIFNLTFDTMFLLSQALIAMMMLYVAFRQWKTSEYKRKQDLFEKRYSIYIQALNLYKTIQIEGCLSDEAIINLMDIYNQALFLFDKNIASYILSIRHLKKNSKIDLDIFNKKFGPYMRVK